MVSSGDPVDIDVEVRCVEPREEVVVGFQLLGPDRGLVTGENGSVKLRPFGLQKGETATVRIHISSLAVPEGIYALSVAAHSPVTNEMYDWHEAAYELAVETQYDATRMGPISLGTTWTLERNTDSTVPVSGASRHAADGRPPGSPVSILEGPAGSLASPSRGVQ
jgi:hypothetical protein